MQYASVHYRERQRQGRERDGIQSDLIRETRLATNFTNETDHLSPQFLTSS